jgi:hypothetical protein
MHFEILVEDASGKIMLDALAPKIIGTAGQHSFKSHGYRGLGEFPKNQKSASEAKGRKLLDALKRAMGGYGRTHAAFPKDYPATVVVVCDLDDNNEGEFLTQLESILDEITRKRPDVHFCLAIEEGEAWLLGDPEAVRAAYPMAKEAVLMRYGQDSICGTWELLADAIHHGGHRALERGGYQVAGAAKCQWAARIAPLMEVGRNVSPSFGHFRKCLEDLAAKAP